MSNCLSYVIRRIGGLVSAAISSVGCDLRCSVTKTDSGSFSIQKVHSNYDVLVSGTGDAIKVSVDRKCGKMSCSLGLVCSSSLRVPSEYNVLWVQDGMLLTLDGGNLFVVKE